MEALGLITVERAPFNIRTHRYEPNQYRLAHEWQRFEPKPTSTQARKAMLAKARGRPKVQENQKGKRGDLLIREVSVRGVVSWSTSYDEKEEIELIRKRAGFLPSMTSEDLPRFLAKALCGRSCRQYNGSIA